MTDSAGSPRVKILFVAANPASTTRLRVDQELREIEQRLRGSKHGAALSLVTRLAARPNDLRRALLEVEPHIVHFSGHGTDDHELTFEDERGHEHPVTREALAGLFATLCDRIRVVVLNACHSQPQAEAITQHIDCAIGMSQDVGDEAAIEFAATFYEALAFGRSVQVAFDLGKNALQLNGIPEDLTPQLVAREGVDPRTVVLATVPVPAPVSASPSSLIPHPSSLLVPVPVPDPGADPAASPPKELHPPAPRPHRRTYGMLAMFIVAAAAVAGVLLYQRYQPPKVLVALHWPTVDFPAPKPPPPRTDYRGVVRTVDNEMLGDADVILVGTPCRKKTNESGFFDFKDCDAENISALQRPRVSISFGDPRKTCLDVDLLPPPTVNEVRVDAKTCERVRSESRPLWNGPSKPKTAAPSYACCPPNDLQCMMIYVTRQRSSNTPTKECARSGKATCAGQSCTLQLGGRPLPDGTTRVCLSAARSEPDLAGQTATCRVQEKGPGCSRDDKVATVTLVDPITWSLCQ